MYFRKSKKSKVRNFSVEDFKMMATYGVFCFAATSEGVEVKAEEKPVEVKADAEVNPEPEYFYTVQKGDSLSKISGLYGSTPEKFKESNPELIKDVNNILVGSKLRVPRDSGRVTYDFQKGDTGTGIAKKLGVSWKDVEAANKGFKWDKAKIGARIYVPRARRAQTSQAQVKVSAGKPVQSKNPSSAIMPQEVKISEGPSLDPDLHRDLGQFHSFRRKDGNYGEPLTVVKDINEKDIPKGFYRDRYGYFSLNGAPIDYSVVKGDTLDAIAKRHGTTVDRIRLDNKGVDPQKLRIGQKLKIQKLSGNVSGFDENFVDLKAPIEWEGFDETARQGKGEPHLTIGHGHHHKDVKPGEKITREKAAEIYNKDMEEVVKTVKKWNINNKLTPYQYQVLLDYGFNAGVGNLKSVLVNHINKGKLGDALKAMTPTNQYNDNPGLRNRHDWRKYYWGFKSYH